MMGYIIASIIAGLVFGILDGIIHANPIAVKLYEAYKPIARTSVNAPAGIVIDLIYGFIIAGIFLILYKSLPGANGLLKGLSFALLVWFFRIVMSIASSWIMYNVPITTLLYDLLTGLAEMIIIGILFGLVLKPAS